MHEVEMQEISGEFAKCWKAAGTHIQRHAQGPMKSWLKASLTPPFLEHLSFRLGNQLFFVRLEDAEGKLTVPGTRQGLLMIADGCKGYPCIMPMQHRAGAWTPDRLAWGLIDARTGKAVDPIALISDEKIEMTEWELQDFAVQVVRDQLKKDGKEVMSCQGNPAVDPSIWFVGESGPEWIVIRAARYPTKDASRPANWQSISEQCSRVGKVGYFASVSFANADDAFDVNVAPPKPLWRGHGMFVSFKGLSPG